MTGECPMCGGVLPVPKRGRAPLYCSNRCRTRAWRTRTVDTAPGPAEAVAKTEGIPSLQLADALALAARRTAMSLNAGLAADPGDLDRLAVNAAALIARARTAHPGIDWSDTAPAPSVQVATLSSRDDKVAREPAPAPAAAAETATKTAAAARANSSRDDSGRTAPPLKLPKPLHLSRKKALALLDTVEMVKSEHYQETGTWHVVAADGTVICHIAPNYTNLRRNGWNAWPHGSMPTSHDRYPTRERAAAAGADSWLRMVTAKPRR